MDRAWRRALDGCSTAVIGADSSAPPKDYPLLVVAVGCDHPNQPLAPVLESRAEMARWLGWTEPLVDRPHRLSAPSPRRELLGDRNERNGHDALLHSFQQLGLEADGGVVLAFEAVDGADPATLETLRRMVVRRRWLRIPLVLFFRAKPTEGAAAALLSAVEQIEGPMGVERLERATGKEVAAPVALPPLPSDVLRALRAAATTGTRFEASLVADLLEIEPIQVLELLQEAHELGVPLQDRGDGRFQLPSGWIEVLRRGVLPSLAAAWHRRLAELIGQSVRELGDGFAARETSTASTERPGEPAVATASSLFARAPAANGPTGELRPASAPLAHQGAMVPIEGGPPSIGADEELESFVPRPVASRRAPGLDARAARHLEAAGDHDAAIERFLAASEEAASRGSNQLAIDYGREALALLVRLPQTPARRRLRIDVLARRGRLQWEEVGPGTDFTLASALKTLEEALDLVRDDDPPDTAARIRSLIAGVCYHLGDGASLERALSELTRASQDLHRAGDALGAAQLFNDQAAVWVRLGDPVRAHHLLNESRTLFEKLAGEDDRARIELAETDHLIARLPLHVRAKPGREADAVEVGLRHARGAEQAYRELGAMREVARVWETIGRLELLRGDGDAAAQHLTRAVDTQGRIGDVLGLAQSSGALAELLATAGRVGDALAILGDSIGLNSQKGSPLGLAYNRRSFERFRDALAPAQTKELTEDLARIESQLTEGEASLGQLTAPE